MSTIKEVAKKAGVSTSTVSRTLSGNIPVNEITKEKVLLAVKELNYNPNTLAKGLKQGKTNTIALIIPDICNPIFPQLAKAIDDKAREYGYNVILCNTDENVEKEKEIIEMLRSRWIDGMILATASINCDHIYRLKEEGFPIVLAVRNIDNNFDSVVTNNFQASYEAVQYLIQRGHKRIAILNGDLNLGLYRERYHGYKKALEEEGLPLINDISITCSLEKEDCYMKVTDMLHQYSPDAIFATSDVKAIEAVRAIKDQGLRVPEDISVIGFDDIEISSFIDPTLTTVAQPLYEMGELAVVKLVKILNQKVKKKPKFDVVKSKLLIKNSTR